MIQPSNFEIRCARIEQELMNDIGKTIGGYLEARPSPFPITEISGDVVGALPTTIKYMRRTWFLGGRTPLGDPIEIAIQIGHDDTWIPVIAISSTEFDEPHYVVAGDDPAPAIESARAFLDRAIQSASARSQYQRENLLELVKGRTSFTIYD